MNKKSILILTFAVVMFLITTISLATAEDLEVSLNYTPYPAIQGQDVNLIFTIENTGEENLTDLEFILDEGSKFDLVGNDKKNIAVLNAGQTSTITYVLNVEDSASGNENVNLEWNYKKGSDEKNNDNDFTIRVSEKDVFLTIADAKTTPSNLIPGQTGKLDLTLENEANSNIKDIVVSLDFTNLPFAPSAGVTEKKISSINVGDSEKISFDIGVLQGTEPKTYKVPVALKYYDSYGQIYQKVNIISLSVFSEPELDFAVDKNQLILGSGGKISLYVFNKGLTDVFFSDVKLLESSDYRILSSNSAYIGKISSDDYDSADFEIILNKENVNLQFEIRYKDANNNKYSKSVSLPVKVYSKEEAIAAGLIKVVVWPYFLLGLIVIIVLWVVIARAIKKKRKENAKRLS